MRTLASAVVFFVSASALATDRYASPTGSGSACTIRSPCQIATAAAASRPGDRVKLNNGRYTGTSSMISPTVSGTAGNPITFEAINDGQVEIDGQGVRTPVNGVLGVDWITIEGINTHDSSQEVLRLNRVNHWTLRRVVAWDAKDANFNVLAINYGTNNLIEDVGLFGVGRKTALAFGTPGVFMFVATVVFLLGRKKFVHIPPAGLRNYSAEFFNIPLPK